MAYLPSCCKPLLALLSHYRSQVPNEFNLGGIPSWLFQKKPLHQSTVSRLTSSSPPSTRSKRRRPSPSSNFKSTTSGPPAARTVPPQRVSPAPIRNFPILS